MAERELILPELLIEMLAQGRWPRDAHEMNAQHLRPRASAERVAAATNGDEGTGSAPTYLWLSAPPFPTVAQRVAWEGEFWTEFADPKGIVLDLAIRIGDFGLGSDAPIVLDYREQLDEPRVLRLRYAGRHKHWVVMAPTFAAFVEMLGL